MDRAQQQLVRSSSCQTGIQLHSVHLSFRYDLSDKAFVKTWCTDQNPYMEQQFPFGQFPQTVSPFDVPQVPSIVTRAVAIASGAMEVLTGPITGSPVVVAGALGFPSLQPLWQPFATRQCPSVVPQNLGGKVSTQSLLLIASHTRTKSSNLQMGPSNRKLRHRISINISSYVSHGMTKLTAPH